jgi:uncharacterized delta-60 repeat protein
MARTANGFGRRRRIGPHSGPQRGRGRGSRLGRTLALAAGLLSALLPPVAWGQDGTLDPTFSGDGVRTLGFDRPPDDTDSGMAVAVQPDGRLLFAGFACATDTDCHAAVTRMLATGGLDSPYGTSGRVTFPFADSARSYALAILWRSQDGGSIVVGASDPGRIGLAALDSEGELDPAFGDTVNSPGTIHHLLPGGNLSLVVAAARQSDQKILVAGYGSQTGFTDSDFFVARFTAAGQYDTSFSTDGVAWVFFDQGGGDEDILGAMALQSDGRIVVAGVVGVTATDEDAGFARLTSTGALDTSFDGDGGAGNGKFLWDEVDDLVAGDESPKSLVVQPDGRILFAGADYPLSPSADTAVFFGRLLANGATDPSLDARRPDLVPAVEHEQAFSIVLQSDGKPIVVFQPGGAKGCGAARYDANGNALDPGFGTGGVVSFSNVGGTHALCTQAALAGGRLTVVGQAQINPNDVDFIGFRFRSALVFEDGFEGGSTAQW